MKLRCLKWESGEANMFNYYSAMQHSHSAQINTMIYESDNHNYQGVY